MSYYSLQSGKRHPGLITSVRDDVITKEFTIDIVVFQTNGQFYVYDLVQGNKPGQWQWPDMIS